MLVCEMTGVLHCFWKPMLLAPGLIKAVNDRTNRKRDWGPWTTCQTNFWLQRERENSKKDRVTFKFRLSTDTAGRLAIYLQSILRMSRHSLGCHGALPTCFCHFCLSLPIRPSFLVAHLLSPTVRAAPHERPASGFSHPVTGHSMNNIWELGTSLSQHSCRTLSSSPAVARFVKKLLPWGGGS